MSFPTDRHTDWTGWVVLALCLGATIWYAMHQFVFSLLFLYQLLRPVWVQ